MRASTILFAALLLSPSASAQMTQFCFPGQGGVVPCPCNNPPTSVGRGCDNFGPTPPGGTGGAELSATGVSSASPANTLTLVVDGMVGLNPFHVVFKGTAASSTGFAMAAGVRCAAGTLRRIYRGNAPGGSITYPNPSAPTDAWTASGMPLPGTVLYYFVAYRNPGAAVPCGNPTSTVNTTNAGSVLGM